MEQVAPPKKLDSDNQQLAPNPLEQGKSASIRIIRTMKNDAEEVIRSQNETSVSIAIAEEKKRAQEQARVTLSKQSQGETPPPAKRIGRFFIVLILLFGVTVLGLAYVFILPTLKNITLPTVSIPSFGKPTEIAPPAPATPKIEPLATSILPAQSEKRFNIIKETPEKVLEEISKERKQGNSAGSIKNLYFAEESGSDLSVISANRFFGFLDIQAPDGFTRSLEKLFMVGFFGEANGGTAPFFIFNVSDHDSSLAGILEWEKTLPRFFDTVFGTNIVNGVTTTTKFSDIVVLGKDARILNTAFGGTLVYTFVNKNTLIITSSLTSLEALVQLATKN